MKRDEKIHQFSAFAVWLIILIAVQTIYLDVQIGGARMYKFAKRLRRLRRGKLLSQNQLGEQVGIARVTIYAYEHGERNPTAYTLCQLADFFGVSVDFLLGRSDKRNVQP
jgi:DNA-binding XRE family transcriptional regulator